MKDIRITYSSSVGSRTNNEDNFLVPGRRKIRPLKANKVYAGELNCSPLDGPVTAAVSDGMGGTDCGEIASATALNLFRSKGTIDQRAQRINQHLLQLQAKKNIKTGCTLVSCEIRTDGISSIAYVSSVGDSPCFILHRDELKKVTRDDNLLQKMLDEGRAPETAEDYAYASSGLLRYLGMNTPQMTLQKHRILLEPGDVLILCTDGVCLDGDVPFFMDDHNPAESLVRFSVDRNIQAGNESDNATAIIIEIGG